MSRMISLILSYFLRMPSPEILQLSKFTHHSSITRLFFFLSAPEANPSVTLYIYNVKAPCEMM